MSIYYLNYTTCGHRHIIFIKRKLSCVNPIVTWRCNTSINRTLKCVYASSTSSTVWPLWAPVTHLEQMTISQTVQTNSSSFLCSQQSLVMSSDGGLVNTADVIYQVKTKGKGKEIWFNGTSTQKGHIAQASKDEPYVLYIQLLK
jgi:hypothetical protein